MAENYAYKVSFRGCFVHRIRHFFVPDAFPFIYLNLRLYPLFSLASKVLFVFYINII